MESSGVGGDCAQSSEAAWASISVSMRHSDRLGSMPKSSARIRLAAWKERRASACRPQRYRASISSSQSRSRRGWSSTRA